MALLDRAARSEARVAGSSRPRARDCDLGPGQPLGCRRGRRAVGCDQLRRGDRPGAGRDRQRRAVSHRQALTEGRRSALPRERRCAGCEDRPPEMVLPADTGRQLGLHLHPAHDPDPDGDRRRDSARWSSTRPRTVFSTSSTGATASSCAPIPSCAPTGRLRWMRRPGARRWTPRLPTTARVRRSCSRPHRARATGTRPASMQRAASITHRSWTWGTSSSPRPGRSPSSAGC